MKKKMSILLSAAMLGCAFPLSVHGNSMVDEVASIQQNKTVKGRVIDANGEPVIGASVLEKGTTNGTITDFDGNFQLNVKEGALLSISYIGYAAQELVAQANMNITL